MADLPKKKRSQALSNFTRNVTTFNSLLGDSAPSILVRPQFDKVQSCWEKLELAQECFIEKTDIDIDTHKDGLAYLDEPGNTHSEILHQYSEYLKGGEEDDKHKKEREEEQVRLLEEEKRKRASNEMRIAETSRLEEEC